jgi:hypothetical protein
MLKTSNEFFYSTLTCLPPVLDCDFLSNTISSIPFLYDDLADPMSASCRSSIIALYFLVALSEVEISTVLSKVFTLTSCLSTPGISNYNPDLFIGSYNTYLRLSFSFKHDMPPPPAEAPILPAKVADDLTLPNSLI